MVNPKNGKGIIMIELIKQYITDRFDVQAVQCEIETVPENCLYMYGLLLIRKD